MGENRKIYLYLITFVAAMGGLLFGYDWVVIGGAKPFYEVFFDISDSASAQGWVMGSAILGCLIGVLFSGSLSDRYGRKPLMYVAAVVFIISAIGTGVSDNLAWFIAYRVLGGIGIGIASNVSPMYIAESAPTKIRGQLVSINQLTIVIGILLAQLVNWFIAEPVAPNENILNSWNGQMGWRWMFWAEGVLAFLFFVLLFVLPESPRWLSSKLKFAEAQKVLTQIGGASYASREIAILETTALEEKEKINYSMLRKGKMPKIILVGVVIAVFQQWCGINVIFNYAQEVFSAAGYGVSDILFNIVITGVINVIFTFVGMYTVDKLGRRTLLMSGASGLVLIYALMGACYYFNISGLVVLVLVLSAIACYAMTLAPVTWVVISEIFPTKVRGMAMAISTFALWGACFLLTFTFPMLNKGLGAHGTFWLYGAICLMGLIFIWKNLVETKGKSLEEIEKEIRN